MIGDKLSGNQKHQHRLERTTAKKIMKIKRCFLKSVRNDSHRKESTGLWEHWRKARVLFRSKYIFWCKSLPLMVLVLFLRMRWSCWGNTTNEILKHTEKVVHCYIQLVYPRLGRHPTLRGGWWDESKQAFCVPENFKWQAYPVFTHRQGKIWWWSLIAAFVPQNLLKLSLKLEQ